MNGTEVRDLKPGDYVKMLSGKGVGYEGYLARGWLLRRWYVVIEAIPWGDLYFPIKKHDIAVRICKS